MAIHDIFGLRLDTAVVQKVIMAVMPGGRYHEPSIREARRRIVEFIDRHLAAPGA